jgi:hypothetical protein
VVVDVGVDVDVDVDVEVEVGRWMLMLRVMLMLSPVKLNRRVVVPFDQGAAKKNPERKS